MTERLYYDDSYMTAFDATVEEVRAFENRTYVRLDRTAFYPTSGGQPYDTGRMNGAAVTDVMADDAGEVWHAVEGALCAGTRVQCEIDWARRFDHMQQHGGEHMLAGEIYRQLGGTTIGLHLGSEFSSIDVEMPGGETHLTPAQISLLEEAVNRHIQADAPVRCFFPSPEALKALPLRKPPTVREHVRIVAFGDFEMVACGGTHPSSSGQIGLLKIIDARPSKGKVRVSFLCGQRAFCDYAKRFAVGERAAASLSVKVDLLPEAVARLLATIAEQSRQLGALRREAALRQVPELLRSARDAGHGARVATCALPSLSPDALREVAAKLTEAGGMIALLCAERPEGGVQLLFARSADVDWDMGKLLKESALRHNGKGGGKSDFAQGGAQDAAVLETALSLILHP